MLQVNFVGAIAAVVIIIVGVVVVSFIRKQVKGTGNQTAITLLQIGDSIILFRFITGMIFMSIFIAIALAAGGTNGK